MVDHLSPGDGDLAIRMRQLDWSGALVQELVKRDDANAQGDGALHYASQFLITIPLARPGAPSPFAAAPGGVPAPNRSESFVREVSRWLDQPRADADVEAMWVRADVESFDAPASEDHSGPRARIVWADDNAELRDYVARLLAQRFEVEAVADGESALVAIRANPPDLVLSDVVMPGVDGFALLRALRGDPQFGSIPIVLLWAHAHDDPRLPDVESGTSDYLARPFSVRVLLARLGAHLQIARVRRASEQAVRHSEARKAAMFEAALDCIISIDHQGRIIEFNAAAERTFGYRRQEVLGREMADCLIPPALREPHRQGLARYLATGEGPILNQRIELAAVRSDGTEFPVELTVTCLPTDGPPVFTGYLRDITERKYAERRLKTQYSVSRIVAEAATLDEAASSILRAICELLGWQVGALWYLDRQDNLLRCAEVFCLPSVRVPRFEAMTRQRTFAAGVGLPGRVFASGSAAWIRDVTQDSNFPRAPIAAAEGLHGAFGFPILLAGEVVGVLEFFSHEIRQPDEDLLQLMTAVGSQIGQFVERKRAEDALRESEQRLRLALEAGPMGTWEWKLDTNAVVWSPSLEAIHGLAPGSFGGTLEAIHPDDREKVKNSIAKSLEDGSDHYVEYRIVWPDGSLHWVEGRGKLFRDDAGRPLRMIGVCSDITERKQAEEALKESQERFGRFMQHLPGLAWIKDVDGRYVFANDAAQKAFQTSRENLYGKTDDDVFPPEVAAQFRANDRRALEDSSGVQVVETLEHNDGVLHHSIVSKFPIPGGAGQPTLVGGMAIDITDRKQAEEELRRLAAGLQEADRRKTEFLATLAHELRNPLAPIRTGLELMRMSKNDPALLDEVRGTMERQLQQMVRLIDDLLDVSRITSGKLELRRCKVELAQIVQNAVEAARPFIDERRHELSVTLPGQRVFLDADPHRMSQVLSNLLNNAAKYTPEGGRIALAAQVQGAFVRVAVRDSGIGIPPDMLDYIFQMFAQVDQSLERGYTGLGIGLTLAKSLVEMHGGRIEVQSAGANQGSEFSVRLPILAVPAATAPRALVPEISPPGPARRLLVVDDNKDAANGLAMMLRMLGNEVAVAYDGLEALDAAEQFRPDAVLLDLGMPRLNGYDTARRIRSAPWGADIVLVALTGWGQDEDKERTREAGFDHHLTKPAEPAALQAILETVPPRRVA